MADLTLVSDVHKLELGQSIAEMMLEMVSFPADSVFMAAEASITFTIRDGEALAGTWTLTATRADDE